MYNAGCVVILLTGRPWSLAGSLLGGDPHGCGLASAGGGVGIDRLVSALLLLCFPSSAYAVEHQVEIAQELLDLCTANRAPLAEEVDRHALDDGRAAASDRKLV